MVGAPVIGGIRVGSVPVATIVGPADVVGLPDSVELQPAARTAHSTAATVHLARTAAGYPLQVRAPCGHGDHP